MSYIGEFLREGIITPPASALHNPACKNLGAKESEGRAALRNFMRRRVSSCGEVEKALAVFDVLGDGTYLFGANRERTKCDLEGFHYSSTRWWVKTLLDTFPATTWYLLRIDGDRFLVRVTDPAEVEDKLRNWKENA